MASGIQTRLTLILAKYFDLSLLTHVRWRIDSLKDGGTSRVSPFLEYTSFKLYFLSVSSE